MRLRGANLPENRQRLCTEQGGLEANVGTASRHCCALLLQFRSHCAGPLRKEGAKKWEAEEPFRRCSLCLCCLSRSSLKHDIYFTLPELHRTENNKNHHKTIPAFFRGVLKAAKCRFWLAFEVISVYNCFHENVNFNMGRKALMQQGFQISPEKAPGSRLLRCGFW